MIATLASLVVELAANTAKFQSDMRAAAEAARRSGAQITNSLKGIESSFTSAIRGARNLASALGVVTTVGGFVALTGRVLAFADSIDEMSERLGIGIERLQELRFAAGQSGVSAEQLELGIRNLGNTVADAARGEEAAVKAFRDMGVSIEGVAGSTAPLEVVMGRVADRINSAVSPTEKLGIASKAFGERVGSFLIPILGRGQKGIEDWAKAAREAGVVISTEMIQQAAKAKDMLDAMATSIMANLVPAIVAISPLLIKMAQGLSDIAAAAGRAMGSFAPFAAMTTEDLRAQLAKVDADLAKRREFLQKLREENEERSKGLVTQFLPKSPGAIPHEIQRLQLEKEAIEKVLAERGTAPAVPTVRGMVIGTGVKDDKVLEGLRKKLQDLGTEDDFAKQIVALQRDLAAAKKEAPGFTAEIDRLGAAMFEAATNQKVFSDALKNRAATAEAEAKTEQESADVTAEAWRFYYEFVAKQEAERVAAAAAAAASQVESAQLVQDALDEAQTTTANLPKSLTQIFAEDMAQIAASAALFGDAFDATSAKIARLREEMQNAIKAGAKPWHEAMMQMKADIESLRVTGVFDDLDKQMRSISAQSAVLGNSFDTVAAEANAVRQALVQLLGLPATSETEKAIATLTLRLDELNAVALAQTGIRDIFGALNQAVNQSVAGVIQGTLTLEEAFKNMGQSIALSLIQNIINRGINVVMEAVIAMVAKLAAAGLSGYGAGVQAAGAPIMVGAGSGIPGGAEGAYVKHTPGGSLMRVGEGGKDEAIFPLDRVPVNPGSGGGKTSIVINNNAGAEVGASEKQTPDGRQIEVMIDRVVTDGFSSGRYGGVLSSTYGLNRKGRVS